MGNRKTEKKKRWRKRRLDRLRARCDPLDGKRLQAARFILSTLAPESLLDEVIRYQQIVKRRKRR